MITYTDGTAVQVGDRVDYDGELSTVDTILDTAEQCADWGLVERGLMLKNASYGLVFDPVDPNSHASVVFLGREP